MRELEKLIKSSNYGRNYIAPNLKYDRSLKWHQKKVESSLLLFDLSDLTNIKTNVPYLKNDKEIILKGQTSCINRQYREVLSFTKYLNNLDLSKYNRLHLALRIDGIGHRVHYVHLSYVSNGENYSDAVCVKENIDEEILFELSLNDRSKVTSISLTLFLMGTPVDATDDIELKVRSISIEKVEAEYDFGFKTHDIAYSQIGYLPNDKKIAIISDAKDDQFSLMDEKGNTLLKEKLQKIETNLGLFYLADFSSFKKKGLYQLKIADKKTELFEIEDDIYDSSVIKSLYFLKTLRCAEQIDNVHAECHVNMRAKSQNGDSVSVCGGWHDAGDVSQFEIPTAEITASLAELYFAYLKNDQMAERIKEELKVGVKWLLKTHFGNGERALAVTYNIWRDNVLKHDDDTYMDNVAENGPFENLLASTALAKASLVLTDDVIYNDYIKRIAIADFNFALDGIKKGLYSKRWGPLICVTTSGEAVKAALALYKATKDDTFLKEVDDNILKIINCQEQNGIGKLKIKGYFYEDEEHLYTLNYEHRGHEQIPLEALCTYVKYCNEENNKGHIYDLALSALENYKEFVLKTLTFTKPFNLVPATIYNINKLNLNHFTIPKYYGERDTCHEYLKDCIKEGIKITDDEYLRIFPISIDRRGFLATHLSKIKGLAEIYELIKDEELKEIIRDQIEWVFGKNPFATSFMYGEGHSYHPLYVAFTDQIVGAMPVGIKTHGTHDLPYWPQATQAVYKEIWGHTTSKYLGIIAKMR